jgi:hypothetical protein
MRKGAVILGAALLVGAITAAIIPMWVATARMGLPAAGWGAVILMVVFCFAVGGGLMFLIFFSARQGYDDAAHHGAMRRDRLSTRVDGNIDPPPPEPRDRP